MTYTRKTAVFTGLFFIIATAMGILNAGMVGPILGSENYLVELSTNSGAVLLGAFFNTIMAVAVVAISIAIYPVLKQADEALAVGYVAFRAIEGAFLALGGMVWLLLVPLGIAFVEAGAPEISHFQTLGGTLVNASVTVFALGAEITFGITALILNFVLFRAKLVPALISIWGFIGGALLLLLGIMHILDVPTETVEIAFTAPIALNEMVLAIWLIAKGFKDGPTS